MAVAPGPVHYRPQSALSSHMRYRTPMAAPSTSFSPIPPTQQQHYPVAQPLPRYATPSAFDHPDSTSPSGGEATSSAYPPPSTNMSYPLHLSHSSYGTLPPTQNPLYTQQPLQRPPLERAVESVQASLAALRERIEGLEGSGSNPTLSRQNLPLPNSRGTLSPNDNSNHPRRREFIWDPAHMGLWSFVLVPASHSLSFLHTLLAFILQPLPSGGRGGSTRSTVVRRLALDASFVFTVFWVITRAWKASGVRRREVYRALGGVWAAILGTGLEASGVATRPKRIMVDRGV